MKTMIELIKEIDELAKELFKPESLENPETISKIILELSVKNMGLGNMVIEAMDFERQAETQYKYEVDKTKLDIMRTERDDKDKSVSATYSESKAKIETKQLLDEWNECKHKLDVLKVKRSDLDKVIDTGRSRLSLIKQDIGRQQ